MRNGLQQASGLVFSGESARPGPRLLLASRGSCPRPRHGWWIADGAAHNPARGAHLGTGARRRVKLTVVRHLEVVTHCRLGLAQPGVLPSPPCERVCPPVLLHPPQCHRQLHNITASADITLGVGEVRIVPAGGGGVQPTLNGPFLTRGGFRDLVTNRPRCVCVCVGAGMASIKCIYLQKTVTIDPVLARQRALPRVTRACPRSCRRPRSGRARMCSRYTAVPLPRIQRSSGQRLTATLTKQLGSIQCVCFHWGRREHSEAHSSERGRPARP